MDGSIFLGFILGIGGIVLGDIIEGGHIASLIQGTAAIIVFGGTFGAVIVSHGLPEFRAAIRMFLRCLRNQQKSQINQIASELVTAAQVARRESVLALEGRLNNFSTPYMRNVFRFMIDGIEAETLRKIFEPEIQRSKTRSLQIVKVWSDAGGFAPTIGILGAVLGLIHVMANLTDTAALGQGIAVAFVATIYGVGSANLVFIPVANKIRKMVQSEVEIKEMILDGAIAIGAGLNPYIIEEKMRGYSEGIA